MSKVTAKVKAMSRLNKKKIASTFPSAYDKVLSSLDKINKDADKGDAESINMLDAHAAYNKSKKDLDSKVAFILTIARDIEADHQIGLIHADKDGQPCG